VKNLRAIVKENDVLSVVSVTTVEGLRAIVKDILIPYFRSKCNAPLKYCANLKKDFIIHDAANHRSDFPFSQRSLRNDSEGTARLFVGKSYSQSLFLA
jgi:hypothetical protein